MDKLILRRFITSRLWIPLTLVTIALGISQPGECAKKPSSPLDEVAEKYVKLVLSLGQIDPSFAVVERQIHLEESYVVGDKAQLRITVTDAMVRQYAEEFGDDNPIHLDEEAGQKSLFKKRVAHGLLGMNFFGTILGGAFPGRGTSLKSIDQINFLKPVGVGDEIVAQVQVKEVTYLRRLNIYKLTVETLVLNQQGEKLLTGTANVIAPK